MHSVNGVMPQDEVGGAAILSMGEGGSDYEGWVSAE
jgi:hypothetical protein